MPRVKVQKKQTASDLPSTNGNDASSSSTATATEAAVSDVADAIVKQAPKSKVRGKKAVAAAAAAGELNGATEVEEAAVVASVKKPVARGKKKLAEAEDEINVATNGNEASSTPPKSKERGKKTAAEDAAESAPVVAKKSASRGKRKADQVEQDEEPEHTEPVPVKAKGRAKKATTKAAEVAITSKQFDEVEEEPEPAKPKGRAKKATTETVEVATTSKSKTAKKEKATVTKGRAKKEKPDEVKTRTNKAKVQDNETESETEPVAETELVAEPAPKAKAQGRKKKEPEQSEDTEASREKGRAKKGETVVKKTARANKRHLADAEIAEVLEEDAQDEQPELAEPTTTEPKAKAKPAAKKRGKQAKPNDENVELPPPKKRGKKTDTENDEVATAPAKKRTAKQVKDEAAPAESKPGKQVQKSNETIYTLSLSASRYQFAARGRKRPAGGTADEGVDTLAEAEADDEADGSRSTLVESGCRLAVFKSLQNVLNFCFPVTKTSKKAEPKAATDSYDKSLFPPPADKPFNLKISSWNVAGLRAWLKKNGLGFVEAEEPDIFCLQVQLTYINLYIDVHSVNFFKCFRKLSALMISCPRRWHVCLATIPTGCVCLADMLALPYIAK